MIVVQLVLRVYTQTTPFFEKQTIFLWKNKIHLYGAYITYVLNWINGIKWIFHIVPRLWLHYKKKNET